MSFLIYKEELEKLASIREAICQKILELPDNPRTSRLKDGGFVLHYKNIEVANWSVFYYEFKKQYKSVVTLLKHQEGQTFLNTFKTILETGEYKGRKYHPEVIKHLKTLL